MDLTRDEAISYVVNTILGPESILIGVREGCGINDKEFSQLCTVIEFLINEFKNDEYVPKELALCFLDISNFFYFREGFYSVKDSEKLEDCAITLTDLGNRLFE